MCIRDRVEVAIKEIEVLCYEFEVPYDKKNPLICLLQVLEKTLNEWTDEEFFGIRERTRKRLVELGDAVKERCIMLRTSYGKIKSTGIKKVVREIMTEKGDISLDKLKLELDKRNVYYQETSAGANYYSVRKELGYANEKVKTTVAYLVRELFDEGRGITMLEEMIPAVNKRRKEHVLNSTISRELTKLHNSYKLKDRILK